mmetsp:Transcript_24567/g.62191  ORF Transcript_24567/g.62191 Transcript_24567/m.62191 type:complete len:89 (-) Transcript_24567:483-749(-)
MVHGSATRCVLSTEHSILLDSEKRELRRINGLLENLMLACLRLPRVDKEVLDGVGRRKGIRRHRNVEVRSREGKKGEGSSPTAFTPNT